MFKTKEKYEKEIKRYADALKAERAENRRLSLAYKELKIEQQKDKALWIAMCAPKETPDGGSTDESNDSATPEPEHNERPVPRTWGGVC